MIKWALYLQYQSAGAYETIRSYIALPSQWTLRDYSHHTKAHIGFSDETDKQLMSVADVTRIQDWQKYVVVLMDEIHIREDLIYDKHTGALLASFPDSTPKLFIAPCIKACDKKLGSGVWERG